MRGDCGIIIVIGIAFFVILLLLDRGCEERENSEYHHTYQLKKQLEELKSENEKLKEEHLELQQKYEKLKNIYNIQDDILKSQKDKKSSGIYDEVFQ